MIRMAESNLPDRKEVKEEDTWDLSPIFARDELWDEELHSIRSTISDISKYQGQIGSSVSSLATFLHLLDDISRRMGNLSAYAHLRHDQDLSNVVYQAMNDRAQRLYVEIDTATSFLVPEILSRGDEELTALLEEEELKFAAVPLRSIIRNREHYLSEPEEKILAMSGEALNVAPRTFSIFNNADLTFPTIKDDRGSDVTITHAKFMGLLMSPDRRVRREAFQGVLGTYDSFKNTMTSLLDGEFKSRTFMSQVRKYPSALEASLDDDEVTPAVYQNLIDTVREFLPSLHRYLEVRRRAMGLDELHIYDVYVPLVEDFDRKLSFNESSDIIIEALKPLGEEAIGIARKGFDDRWIDRYENRGKRAGAYSSGSYDSNPYILMNYEGNVHDLFTLAHEMGHSIHTSLSSRNQPHIQAEYKIFVAEVASTTNENLLMDHLKKIWTTPDELLYLVNHSLEEFRGTVFRQTMFAQFELEICRRLEGGEPFTSEMLCDIYGDLNREYFGPGVVVDDEIRIEWARIPHFYYNFYVYKYATGYSAATDISRRILSGEEGALEGYLNMLKAGRSKPPLELLKMAGVDLSSPEPIRRGLEVFDSLVTELDELIG